MTRRPVLRAAALAAGTLTVAAICLAGVSGPAAAGGGRLAPVRESYEPGDSATMVGYTGGPTLPEIPAGPFYAYLRPVARAGELRVLDTDVALGRLVLEETRHTGFLNLRVSITFVVPADLDAGEYVVWHCDDPCTGTQIGDLIPSPLSIGADPVRPVSRAWAFDEPEIANLAPDALIVGPDFEATAADVRAGRVAPPPEPPPTTAPAPSPTVDAAAWRPVAAAAQGAGRATAPPPTAQAPAEMDWRLPTALALAAAAATWVLLAHQERACAPELATRCPRASGEGRASPAGRG